MIRKILSGGQSGVEIAALDLAARLGIACGGWVAKDKPTRNSQLLEKYQLKETVAVGFQQAVESNVRDADGALLITRGEKDAKTRYAVQMALKHQKQLLHVDLRQYSQFEAASLISSWLKMQHLQVLYITGPSSEEDKTIGSITQKIMETAFYLDFVKTGLHPAPKEIRFKGLPDRNHAYPNTVNEAVQRLKTELPLKDRALLANMQSNELESLRDNIGEYIKQNFGLYTENSALIASCAEVGRLSKPLADEACFVILRCLWLDLQQTHKLRIIK